MALASLVVLLQACGDSNVYKADVVVYGGTSAAVTAAVGAVKSGKKVIIVSPDIHL